MTIFFIFIFALLYGIIGGKLAFIEMNENKNLRTLQVIKWIYLWIYFWPILIFKSEKYFVRFRPVKFIFRKDWYGKRPLPFSGHMPFSHISFSQFHDYPYDFIYDFGMFTFGRRKQ